jgi:hypothetical protein
VQNQNHGTSSSTILATFVIFKKLFNVNYHPMGENSHNLITLSSILPTKWRRLSIVINICNNSKDHSYEFRMSIFYVCNPFLGRVTVFVRLHRRIPVNPFALIKLSRFSLISIVIPAELAESDLITFCPCFFHNVCHDLEDCFRSVWSGGGDRTAL